MYVGHRHECRSCNQARWGNVRQEHKRRYYHENTNGYRDKVQEKEAAKFRTSPEHRERLYAFVKDYGQRHPERVAAHRALQREVRAGRIMRQPCIHCGEKARAHHDDYAKPLDVIWLCPAHHGERHRLLNRGLLP